jgi:hypothetical protein
MFGIGRKKANPTRDFEAAIKKAISIGELSGVAKGEMSAIMSSWCVSWERQALMARERRQFRTDGLHVSGNLPE